MPSISDAQGPFPSFERIASAVWYFDPAKGPVSNGVGSTSVQPDLIVLSTWMGAHPKHIQKYTAGYTKLFPRSPILLMTNSARDIIFPSYKFHKQNLKPVIRVIHDVALSEDSPNILLHAFSNGGALHAIHLATLYHQQFNTALPVSSIILDSTPGRASWGRSVKAMAVGLPKFILLRLLGLLVIHLICLAMWVNHHILGRDNIITRVRKQLVDPELFPISAPRCYVYSTADEMVGWQDVENHAQVAEAKGYQVEKLERFDDSKHVSHMVMDPSRYWGIVQKMAKLP